ncbi:MAG: hypothetical protein A3J07_02445 [Candidatus Doudnabacteria bacterium RIFCSPLOWO2_02_FULL_49_13]|uniref:DUF2784 domain-containing protein n=1 Tax=Candidatus Doudnabacteria bacterium RIFCSPHIGHO2_12_FULL_48_16 TaxID=1817838 RepID=A0A1F5PLI7_9BACT|nr:MAG: hypothetical protein A3B77_03380 [Candidatus Doudnabacteria bacterium RIFCSPHIGHO2_02_FULL_49_24]OGE89164.1 MAG: hypothetical protein A2760_02125 [Candidatus Doudnabacteria bacterium RIFCSPHIGHO2_01_FULL_50_67]OGE90540.1 MAG: hypothetical protein A3E29_01960 [Candidatus Doudnabacteria bacterium RIFCSPHIGHO2_12_FULL_48_16]OGE97190.1 MAG: hypothetical protein A2990_01155 [Candidatus Doudnabacteria bacterium RIFCSPLOWO2_01_FULL_49_40]OGF02932.1 MAG: hypothetical protein A3J07_02445 [Candid
MKVNKLIARLVLSVHAALLAIGLLSIVIVLIFPQMAYAVLVLPLLSVVQWLIFKDHCLLTDLENKYLKQSGQGGYSGGCIRHYLWKWASIERSDQQVDYILYGYVGILILIIVLQKTI